MINAEIEIPDLGTVSHAAYTWTRPDITLLPGGSLVTRTYDPLMRQTSVTATDPGANPVMTLGYSFDAENNITAKTTKDGEYAYTYDDLYRLTDSNTPDIPDLSDEAFTYDPVGNRLTASDTIGHWTYNGNNELESRGSTGYDYDANGNLTQKTVNGSVTRFFYNIENRLIRVEDGSGTIIAQYGYDPFGRRIWKEVSGNRTYYLYSDEGLAGEYTETGTQIRAYGWQPGSVWGTDPLFMKEGSEYYFYHNDHLGTPQKMTAVNGAVVWSARYTAFGQAIVDPASTVENNLRFPGQYFDAETGYHYNYHRYYNPDTGRYLTPDPIGLAGGINLFSYAINNSINFNDPLGLLCYKKDENGIMQPCDRESPPVNIPLPQTVFQENVKYCKDHNGNWAKCDKIKPKPVNDYLSCRTRCEITRNTDWTFEEWKYGQTKRFCMIAYWNDLKKRSECELGMDITNAYRSLQIIRNYQNCLADCKKKCTEF